MELRPLGFLRSCFTDKFAVPRQALMISEARSRLTLENWCQPEAALQGLEAFTHVWLVFGFHDLGDYAYSPKVRPPRLAGEKVGVFASRSPHRPNPIGLSVGQIEKIEGATLFLRGLDLIDGTPIYDLKPYVPSYDRVQGARDGWVGQVTPTHLEVSWASGARVKLNQAARTTQCREWGVSPDELAHLIDQMISADPRPYNDRDRTGRFGFRVYDLDVRFEIQAGGRAEVLEIVP